MNDLQQWKQLEADFYSPCLHESTHQELDIAADEYANVCDKCKSQLI